jgi:hypothetical protein
VTNDGSFTGCVSRECIQDEGSFRTGLTLQQVRGVLGRAGLPPSVVAVSIFQRTANDRFNNVLLAEEGSQQQAGASSFLFRHRNAPGVAPPIVVHSFYIARDVKDELDMFTFESPEATWDESWAIVDQILKHLMIDVHEP